ncbi:hypothetical protein BH11ARM2_BH11ARM2_18250 [soil metagenome]
MKRLLPLAALLLLAGCQGGESKKDADAADGTEPDPPIGAPATLKPSRLFLVGGESILRLGDDWGDAEKVFPAPKESFPVSELPDRFGKPYSAKGWNEAHDGFGVILYSDRIAAAMVQNERPDASSADKIRKRYGDELSSITPVEVRGGNVNFTFWEDGDQRLMLLEQKMENRVRTTIALGDKNVMDGIGASVERAQQDTKQLDSLTKDGSGDAKSDVENDVPKGQSGGAN